MKQKSIYHLGILLTMASLTGCQENLRKTESESRPNVLFIICDDLNDFTSGFDGYPEDVSPHIGKFASTATVFSNAHTNVGLCQPSRNSLFTGVYPHRSKDFGWTDYSKNPILKYNKNIVEILRANGYYTMGSGKLLHNPNNKIWDEWGVDPRINYGPHATDGEKIIGHPSVPEPFRGVNNVDGSFAPLSDIPVIKDSTGALVETGWTYGPYPFRYVNDNDRDPMPDEMHADWAVEKIHEMEKRNSDQPFFLGVGFVKPHTPLYAPKEYFDRFPLDKIKIPEINNPDQLENFYRQNFPDTDVGLLYYQALVSSYPDKEMALKLFTQAYLACIAFVDDQVGKVIDELENSRFSNNTMVILTSDHGWELGEREYLYKNSPWEEGTRIPLIIKLPGKEKKGTTVNHPVSLIDLFPTFMEVCQLLPPASNEYKTLKPGGYSLMPFLKNPKTNNWDGPEGALTLLGASINTPIPEFGINKNKNALWHIELQKEADDSLILQQNYSYRTEKWRYIMYKNGMEELYDHEKDPGEMHNLANDENFSDQKSVLKNQVLEIIKNK
jgi:arylsulfatase A-like enzyme